MMDSLKLCFLLHTFVLVCSTTINIKNINDANRIPGEYIFALESPINTKDQERYIQDVLDQISNSREVEVRKVLKFHSLVFLSVRANLEASVASVAGKIPGLKGVEVNINQKFIQNDMCMEQRLQDTSWGLPRISYRELPQNIINARYSYQPSDGEGTVAYVFDTGIYLNHEEFEGRAQHGYTAEDLRDEGDNDLNGHGTHVAGTILGKTYGVAKKAQAISLKVLGEDGRGPILGILEAAQWVYEHFSQMTEETAGNFLAVASFSLSASGIDSVDNALQELIDSGLSVVAAAGNAYSNACDYSPARMQDAITVGASNINDDMADFSNEGTCVDILAPGVEITSCGISSPNATVTYSGTSMAAPHVSGAILRFLNQTGQPVTPAEIKDQMSVTATSGVLVRGETPSLLLYAPCDMLDTDPPTSTINNEVTTDNSSSHFGLGLTTVLLNILALTLLVN